MNQNSSLRDNPKFVSWVLTGNTQSDYPLAQGAFFLISLVLIVLNLVVDLIYGWLDPRVSHG